MISSMYTKIFDLCDAGYSVKYIATKLKRKQSLVSNIVSSYIADKTYTRNVIQLKSIREKLGYSLNDVYTHINVSGGTYSSFECLRRVRPDIYLKAKNYLDHEAKLALIPKIDVNKFNVEGIQRLCCAVAGTAIKDFVNANIKAKKTKSSVYKERYITERDKIGEFIKTSPLVPKSLSTDAVIEKLLQRTTPILTNVV